ncbi:hypothetical protein CH372_19840, partial [Leptospira meyeri]
YRFRNERYPENRFFLSDLLQKRVEGTWSRGHFPRPELGGELDPPPNAFPLPRPAPFHTPFLKIPHFNSIKFAVSTLGARAGLLRGARSLPSSLGVPPPRTKPFWSLAQGLNY